MRAHLSHTRRRWTPAASLVAAAAAGAMLLSGLAPASAQDEMEAHPAHIHEGTCDDLNPKPAFPLTNVGEMGMMGGTPEADDAAMEMGEPTGAETAFGVETSYTMVDAALEEIVEGGHAINLHESKENIEVYIACGDIGGRIETGPGMDEGGTLVVGLGELNDSGYAGIAVLEGKGDQTEVVIYLAEGLTGGTGAADEEEATPAAAAGEVVAVELDEFEVRMPSELAAGPTTFRVTNVGGAEHNFEVEGQGIEEEFKENLRPGETKEMTLDLQPGTYEVYCPVGNHEDQGMLLELTVTE